MASCNSKEMGVIGVASNGVGRRSFVFLGAGSLDDVLVKNLFGFRGDNNKLVSLELIKVDFSFRSLLNGFLFLLEFSKVFLDGDGVVDDNRFLFFLNLNDYGFFLSNRCVLVHCTLN